MVADIVILTEDTPQVAMGQEDRAGTVESDQWRLLSEMRRSGREE